MVFAATGSASFDFYGATRQGDNLFANCVLALDARTGKRVWHFQGVEARRLGLGLSGAADPRDRHARRPDDRRRRADHEVRRRLRARSPHRRVALPDRVSQGAAVDDRRRDSSPRRSRVRPKPPPFARQGLTEDMLTTRTPEAHAAVLERFREAEVGLSSTPPSLRRHDRLSRLRRRRRVGRRGVRSRDRRCSTSTRTRCRGSSS